jgi:hypothetical protein
LCCRPWLGIICQRKWHGFEFIEFGIILFFLGQQFEFWFRRVWHIGRRIGRFRGIE